MTAWTYEAVLDAMKAAVAERGEAYIYTEHFKQCRYAFTTDDGIVPGCLVGEVAVRLGVPLDYLAGPGVNDLDADTLLSNLVREERVGDIPEEVFVLCNVAQDDQDRSNSWGYALRHAQEVVTLRFPEAVDR